MTLIMASATAILGHSRRRFLLLTRLSPASAISNIGKTLKELDELLELSPIMKKPVRNLSLGERMKCELPLACCTGPKCSSVDEPTIGLDITAQRASVLFLQDITAAPGRPSCSPATHGRVTALCERIILLHHGQAHIRGVDHELSLQDRPL